MHFGKGAWAALVCVVVGAILWTEGMMATLRTQNDFAAKILGFSPFVLMYVGLFAVGASRRKKVVPGEVTASLLFKGRRTFRERGSLRQDGGLLVFEGARFRFALGHDALRGRPVNLLTNYGAPLVEAPKGTTLQIFGGAKTVREWAKGDSEPTRQRVPLLIEKPKDEYPRGWLANVMLFAVGCAGAGSALGAYLDYRGFSPNGRPLVGPLALAMGGLIAFIGFAAVSTKKEREQAWTKAQAAGFVEVAPLLEGSDHVS